MSSNSSLFCSRLHFRWITKSSFKASVQTGGCRVLSECIYVFLHIPSVGLMRHHLHIWLFYLNKLWNRFCLVLRGKKPLGFCLFYCNVPECISKIDQWKVYAIGAVCVCVWSLKRRARHQISHLPLRVGIISKCVMGYIFMTWQRFKKSWKQTYL